MENQTVSRMFLTGLLLLIIHTATGQEGPTISTATRM
jgi:hypothetical protein